MNVFLLSGCVAIGSNQIRDAQVDSGPKLSEEDISRILELRVDFLKESRRSKMGNASPYEVLGNVYTVLPDNKGYSEVGLASWYGKKFHGRKTSNGEIFDMYRLSAAHRSLVLPAFVRVINLENEKTTVVRVNDRGPFHGNRLIDLSVAAAIQLGFYEEGLARVRVEIVDSPIERSLYNLEVGQIQEERKALEFMEKMRELILSDSILASLRFRSDSKYVVTIGPLQAGDEVDRFEALVKLLDFPSYRIVPLDGGNNRN